MSSKSVLLRGPWEVLLFSKIFLYWHHRNSLVNVHHDHSWVYGAIFPMGICGFMESPSIPWLFTAFVNTRGGKIAFQHMTCSIIAVKIMCLLTFW